MVRNNSQIKILVLGGKPIGSVEIVTELKRKGYYTIVTDFLPEEQSPAKQYADENWDISTADTELLSKKIKQENVSGIITGVHEFNINRMLDLCENLNLPCYCTRDTWKYCDSKISFKSLCSCNDIPVAKVYDFDKIDDIKFPVIVKPVDGSGSRGFHICQDEKDLKVNYADAEKFSPTKSVLIEEYIPYVAVIIHYTIVDGTCYYSGMSDKISVKFESTGAYVMGIQTFPSKGEDVYLSRLNDKVCKMFENAGFSNGPVWIEAFFDGKERFVFNEMGYRFGGSMTNYPVEYFTGFNQLNHLIDVASGISNHDVAIKYVSTQKLKYCILPIHINPGRINEINNLEQLKEEGLIYAIAPVHFVGDDIQEWGSAQQVFAYIHLLYKDSADLKMKINTILDRLNVLDKDGNNMLFTLYDINNIKL